MCAAELERLNPSHRLLDRGIEVLDAHREAIEAEAAQGLEVLHRGHAGIDLDRHLGVGGDLEAGGDGAVEPFALSRGEVGRRAAAPVELVEPTARSEARGKQVELALDGLEVGDLGSVVRRDHDVAAAVGAPRLAERDVDVHRQRGIGRPGGHCEALTIGGLVEAGVEQRRRGVGGVARSGPVVLGKQLRGERGQSEGRGVVHIRSQSWTRPTAASNPETREAWTVRTKASMAATGTSGVMPWPRLAM